MDDLDALLGGAVDAGLTVEIAVDGQRRRLPAALGLTLYRIVQESLTNAARHAAGSRVSVSAALRAGRGRRRGRRRRRRGTGATHATAAAAAGCLGMRERVAVFGGTLEAGPLARRRFRGARPPPGPRGGAVIWVLVADDEALIRDSFRLLLEPEPGIDWSARPATAERRSRGPASCGPTSS